MATGWTLRRQASEKEQELQLLREQHTQVLEEAIKGVENELLVERQRMQQLRTDFEYNLGLLEQRDKELSQYDLTFTEVKRVIGTLAAENSELKVKVDELRGEVVREKESQQQMKRYYLSRISEQQTQTEAYRQAKEQELDSEHRKLETLRCELQQKLLEVEGELQLQRERMAAELDEALRRRDRELESRVSELSAAVLSREAQVRQLGRELQLARSAEEGSKEDASSRAGEVKRLEKQLREKQWEAEDVMKEREAKIAELEGQLAHTHSSLKTLQCDFERRHAELDRLVREKESALQMCKEGHREREAGLERQLREVQSQLEHQEADARRREWSHSDALQEKEREIERYQQQLAEHAKKCEEREGELVREGVARDLRLQSLQDARDKLQADLQRKEEDLEHIRRELSLALERERSVEQSKAQLELDWQQRVGEVERQQSHKHQELIRQLSRARDEALARCRDLQQTVSQQSSVVRAVQGERDVAVATLSKCGLIKEYQTVCQQGGVAQDHVTEPKDHVIEQLRQQNKELHAVIHQMRQEMEQLTGFSEQRDKEPYHRSGDDGPALTVGYVKYMESEVVRLKSENQQLKERVQELSLMKKPPTPPLVGGSKRTPSPPLTGDKPSRRESQHRAHLVALSDTIATLQKEKSALELEVLQLNTKVRQLEESLTAHQEKVHLLRAGQVPRSKVHQKLVQATQAIIALVREKEALGEEGRWLREEVGRLRRLQASGEGRRRSGAEVVGRSEAEAVGRRGAEAVGRSGAEAVGRSGAEAVGRSGAEAVGRSGAEAVGRSGAEAVGRRGAEVVGRRGAEVVGRCEESNHCEVRGPSPLEEGAGDISLHSLKFTDSSDLDDELFEMVDPLSSTLQSEHQDMHICPALSPNQHPPKQDPPPQSLELRGSRVTAHQRVPGGARKHQQAKTRKTTELHKPKPKIRNYNNKENYHY